jgi:hypothetical protein
MVLDKTCVFTYDETTGNVTEKGVCQGVCWTTEEKKSKAGRTGDIQGDINININISPPSCKEKNITITKTNTTVKAASQPRRVRKTNYSTSRFPLPSFFRVIIKSVLVLLLYCEVVSAGTQENVYQEKTTGKCSNLAGGSSITSIAECNQAAAGLGWSDVVVGGNTGSVPDRPPGCYLYDGFLLIYNTLTTSTASCSSTRKCACSILCPPGTYQDEDDQTTCKSCTAGLYQDISGRGDCKSCGKGKYNDVTTRTAEADCKSCGKGKYNDLTARTTESDCTRCGLALIHI